MIARLLSLDEPLGIVLLLLGTAAGAPFLPKLAGIAKSNLAFAVGLIVLRYCPLFSSIGIKWSQIEVRGIRLAPRGSPLWVPSDGLPFLLRLQ